MISHSNTQVFKLQIAPIMERNTLDYGAQMSE